jgi:hypothetical protein
MNIIETTAPISIENLKKFFVDKTIHYLIDYENSSLKGKKLLTYLSNLELPIDIKWENTPEHFDLLKDYLEFEMLVNVKSLELKTIELILEYKNIFQGENVKFIQENKPVLEKWESKIDSLTLYNMYIIDCEEFKNFVSSHPIDETEELMGVNFLSLLKHEIFYTVFQKIDSNKLKFYKKYFEDYMFKGKNLFSYWANEKNTLFLLTLGISENLFINEDYIKAKNEDIKGIKNVSSF